VQCWRLNLQSDSRQNTKVFGGKIQSFRNPIKKDERQRQWTTSLRSVFLGLKELPVINCFLQNRRPVEHCTVRRKAAGWWPWRACARSCWRVSPVLGRSNSRSWGRVFHIGVPWMADGAAVAKASRLFVLEIRCLFSDGLKSAAHAYMWIQRAKSDVWCSHGSQDVHVLVGCNAVRLSRLAQTFRKYIPPPSSSLKTDNNICIIYSFVLRNVFAIISVCLFSKCHKFVGLEHRCFTHKFSSIFIVLALFISALMTP
jgi:hypothetical protein